MAEPPGARAGTAGVLPPRTVAVVVTFNRRELLLECLGSLERQTRPLAGVVVIDNASTDGTSDALRSWAAERVLPVHYVACARNGGGAEGAHFGARHALELDADWLWFLDDDSEPAADALATLLGSEAAARPQTALVAPRVCTPSGQLQLIHRGRLRRRLFLPPMIPLAEHAYTHGARLGYSSFVGPLARAHAVRRAGPPRRDFFIWNDDVEFTERLSRCGELVLIPEALVVHRDGRGAETGGVLELVRKYARPLPFAALWRNMYGLRNLIAWGRRSGYVSPLAAVLYTAQHLARSIVFDDQRLRRAFLWIEFSRQGFADRLVSVSPGDWAALATVPAPRRYLREQALSYADDALPASVLLPGRRPG